MTSSSYTHTTPSGLFGSSLLEDDLFAFSDPTHDNSLNISPVSTLNNFSSANNSPAIFDYSSFDFGSCLVSPLDASMSSLFDADTSQHMFASLFPEMTPPKPAPTATLLPAEAAQLLVAAEASLLANPGLAPAVSRLRDSLRALSSSPPPSSSLSPQSASQATPFLGSLDSFDFAALDFAQATPAAPTAFAVPWQPTAQRQDSLQESVPGAQDPLQKPKSKAGRKRKERPNDPVQLLEELDQKRQRNTESARRSRIKRMAELDLLHQTLANAQEGERKALEKVQALEAELAKAKSLLAMAGEKLKASL
ncbi:hypothetical protein HDU98_011356 [Podochytrium sp. JEL0797]|nr:hypothetical protein HDU98_011356 [Podochytrium sp. JEL0797]